MITALLGHARTTLAIVVLLSVPAFSVCSLIHWSTAATPQPDLAAEDDPIRNGLRSVDAPDAPRAAPTTRAASDEVVVKDWVFMGKGKPSPYQ